MPHPQYVIDQLAPLIQEMGGVMLFEELPKPVVGLMMAHPDVVATLALDDFELELPGSTGEYTVYNHLFELVHTVSSYDLKFGADPQDVVFLADLQVGDHFYLAYDLVDEDFPTGKDERLALVVMAPRRHEVRDTVPVLTPGSSSVVRTRTVTVVVSSDQHQTFELPGFAYEATINRMQVVGATLDYTVQVLTTKDADTVQWSASTQDNPVLVDDGAPWPFTSTDRTLYGKIVPNDGNYGSFTVTIDYTWHS